jgi:tetratricopeptide (TPR) repeat protein
MNENPKALEYHEKSLKIRQKILGEEHIDTAKSYLNIGSVYESMSEHLRAIEYYEKSLKIKKKLLGEDVDTASNYNNIGSVYFGMSWYP